MKSRLVLLSILTMAVALFASVVIPYNNSKKPTLLLPKAYQLATSALGTDTNEFHCISATIDTTFSGDGEWLFTFYSTNSKPKWVSVEFDGKTHVRSIILH
jgi:hypothetical protein